MIASMETPTRATPSSSRRQHPLKYILLGPFRFYHRRIYAQLIVSHLLVALLMAVLLTVGVFTLILTVIVPNVAPALISEVGVTEQTRVLSHLITADDIAALQSGNPASVEAYVNQTLVRAVSAGQPNQFPLPLPSHSQDIAVVMDPSGMVLSSSDPSRILVGQLLSGTQSPLLAQTLAQYDQDRQIPASSSNAFTSTAADGFRATAYPILDSDGKLVGLVLLERADIKSPAAISSSRIAISAAGFVALAVVLFTLPALVLALPFGAWRARRVARRLGTLESATDDMARGDLARRIEPVGEDEIGRLGQRFNVMASSLETADRQRRAFVANVSHELRTPVALIQGNVERLLQRSWSGSEPPAELLVVQHETATLTRLIDDLFTLARLDEAVLPIAPTAVSLSVVAAEVVDSMRVPAWDQRRVTIQSLVDESLPDVLADPTRLRQILGNLIHNALRHTPEGGVVVVDASRGNEVVSVTVSDTGVGISPEDLEHVFQRFYHGSGSSDDGGSVGLGLAIVKQLVEAQGGTVSIESVTGEGTVIRFTLPIVDAAISH